MTEETLVGGDADGGALDLAAVGLAPQLPGDLAHLGDRLRGDRLAEAGEPAARVHRDAAADASVAPERSSASASPSPHSPMFSYQSSSSAVERS